MNRAAGLGAATEAASQFTVQLPLTFRDGFDNPIFGMDGCPYNAPTGVVASAAYNLPDAGNGTVTLTIPEFVLTQFGAPGVGCPGPRTIPQAVRVLSVERLDEGTAFIHYGYTTTQGDAPLVDLFGTLAVSDWLYLKFHFCGPSTPSETCPFPTGPTNLIEVEFTYRAINQGPVANAYRVRGEYLGAIPGATPQASGPPQLVPAQVASNPVQVSWSAGPDGTPQHYVLHAGTSAGASNVGVFPRWGWPRRLPPPCPQA